MEHKTETGSPTEDQGEVVAQTPQMPWLDHYPPGINWAGDIEPQSLVALFDESVQNNGNRPCIDFFGAVTRYRDLGHDVARLTAALQRRGIGRGHRVGLLLPNCPAYVTAYFAILKAGAVVVNLNPLYTIEELSALAADAGVAAVVTLDLKALHEKAAALLRSGSVSQLIVASFARQLPFVKRMMFQLFRRGDVARTGRRRRGRVLSYEALLREKGAPKPVVINPLEDVALFQYTGGTTGRPRAAMLTHANLAANVQQILRYVGNREPGKDRILGILPLFHVFAMTGVMNLGIAIGALMILMPKFDVPGAVKLLRRKKPTILPGVPTLFTALLHYSRIRRSDLESLTFCISGGASLAAELRNQFQEFSGCRIVEGYGLSETSPVVTLNPLDGMVKDGSIGQPLPLTIVSIRSLDDPRVEMPLGEPGEICVRGPQVMKGYWNRPEETAAAFIDGYLRTGDVGTIDKDGFVFIIDRIKDLINISGFKVYPRQIEEAIHTHPAVAEVTVIGVPDAYRGEAPKAFVKLKEGQALTSEELMRHLSTKLSRMEIPTAIEFRDSLPKTLIGKLSKKELRGEGQ
jgi:long-chain acyl-CoA synthetase